MAGSSLVLNRVETIPDGGVDAEITDAPAGGEWIPEGDSVWQFKRSNLYPKECAEEFGRAGWAQQKVRAGSSYVMALGVSLSPKLLAKRRVAILQKAEDLGLNIGGDWLRVYDANALARWITGYPSLAVSRVMGGPGSSATDFATWADSRFGRMEWVPDEVRQAAIETIRSALSRPTSVDLRVEGTPGVGKSRLVLEALRDEQFAPVVACIADEAEMTGEMFHHLVSSRRCVVLVVDRCPADRHGSFAERLPDNPGAKLVTIGPSGYAVTRSPVVVVEPLSSETIDEVLRRNFSGLSNEARRFVVDNSDGYPQLAEMFARRVLDSATQLQAADLVTEPDVRQFITDPQPGSVALRVAEGIALFEKLGWENEVSKESEQLGRFLRISASALQSAGWELEQAGWLAVRGRYRAMASRRLAVFLASRKWAEDGDRIVSELLDQLEEPMAYALFRRLGDLGRYEPAQNAVAPVLAPDGPFGSLEELRQSGRASRLTQLAIVLPNEVALHLHELLEETPEGELRKQPTVCRDLVWALERLAWHTDTFDLAARSLLRMAVAEPTTRNGADYVSARLKTGATEKWMSLFGTMLPATAADLNTRMTYLTGAAQSQDARERTLVVEALEGAIAVREWVMVSGELQGGASVEARGTPQTWGEAWDYQIAAINELGRLVGDPNPQVRSAAEDCLIGAIGPLAGAGRPWGALENVLARTQDLHGRVRYTLQSYDSLYSRADLIDDSDERAQRRQFRMEALDSLKGRLPDEDSRDTLELALNLPRWDHLDRIESVVVDAMAGFLSNHKESDLFEFLATDRPNAGEFGVGLVSLRVEQDAAIATLVNAYEVNPEALIGYFDRKTETDPRAVETFLDSCLGRSMPSIARLEIARIGEPTQQAREIIDELVDRLPVADSAVRVRVTIDDLPEMLDRWMARLDTQQDYNMVVNRVSYELRSNDSVLGELDRRILELVLRRREFPRTGNESSWNWCHLAKAVLSGNEEAMAELLLDMTDNPDRVINFGNTEVSELLRLALRRSTEKVWSRIGERLETGSSRLMHIAEYWCLVEGVEPGPLREWIGTDANRARLVAGLAQLGGDELTPMARYLMATFSDDEQITRIFDLKLDGELQEGNRSAHIQRQIDRLDSWRQDPEEPAEVRRWASKAIARLTVSRSKALEEEAERGW
ncbi:MAG: hypothetical protein OXF41_11205 [bacterium]|nr:hypothetical protein [bacterium]